MLDFKSARHWAEELMRQAIAPGATAVDATMGNGGDTLMLCELVGEDGKVYAFDVQPQALAQTEKRLRGAGYDDRATLILDGHEHMSAHIPHPVDAVVFNLGWLPGAEKHITTKTETTLRALGQALVLVKKGGIITICVYPGHDEGDRERAEVLKWAGDIPEKTAQVMLRQYLNQRNNPPLMIAIQRRI